MFTQRAKKINIASMKASAVKMLESREDNNITNTKARKIHFFISFYYKVELVVKHIFKICFKYILPLQVDIQVASEQ